MAEGKIPPTGLPDTKEALPGGENTYEADSQSETGSSINEHIFKDEVLATYWRGVYEKSSYENRHRFDPNYTWTPAEEKKLVRKVNIMALSFFFCTCADK